MQMYTNVISNQVHFLVKKLRKNVCCHLSITGRNRSKIVCGFECRKFNPLAPIRDTAVQRHRKDARNCDFASFDLLSKNVLSYEIATSLTRHHVQNSILLQMSLDAFADIPHCK